MKKNNIIILSLLIFLTLGIVLFSYANQLTSLIAEAVAPNPGHSWSNLECTTDLCVTSTGVGIGTASPTAKLHVNGNIIASNPTADNHVATKDYVDSKPSGFSTCQTLSASSTVACPAGWTLTGGGCQNRGPSVNGINFSIFSWPNANSWNCRIFSHNYQGLVFPELEGTGTAYAICCM